MSSTIFPDDLLDRDFYIVLEHFREGASFRETDEGIDYPTLVSDLIDGQYRQVLRVVAFNPAEGWSHDASQEVGASWNGALALMVARYPKACRTSSKARLAARLASSCRCRSILTPQRVSP